MRDPVTTISPVLELDGADGMVARLRAADGTAGADVDGPTAGFCRPFLRASITNILAPFLRMASGVPAQSAPSASSAVIVPRTAGAHRSRTSPAGTTTETPLCWEKMRIAVESDWAAMSKLIRAVCWASAEVAVSEEIHRAGGMQARRFLPTLIVPAFPPVGDRGSGNGAGHGTD